MSKRKDLLSIQFYWYEDMMFDGWRGWLPRIRSMASDNSRWRLSVGHFEIHFESIPQYRRNYS